jgi:predicted phosphodiesterase
MRYALVSDIHANIQAWNAVLLDIREHNIDKIICLGDIVGYGPNPAEVLTSVHTTVDFFVLGNHDAVVCGKMSADLFNDRAADVIRWTQNAVNRNAAALLKKVPLSLVGENFRCCHASFSNPGMFDYILSEEDAKESFDAVNEQLLFCGHTHVPELYVLGDSGVPHRLDAQDFGLESNKRYIVNVGSVGNPRAGAPVASYCIYDSNDLAVIWRSVHFDLYSYKQALVDKNLPVEPSAFLAFDSRVEQPPLREQISFSPPTILSADMLNTVEVKNILQLKRSVRLWRIIAVCSIIVLPVTAILLALILMNNNHKDVIGSSNFMPVNSTSAPFDKNLLPNFSSATNQFTSNISIILENKEFQQYSFFKDGDLNGVSFDSTGENSEVQIIFPPFRNINADTKFCIEGFFKKSDDFKGEIALKVLVKKNHDKSFETMFVKPPNPNLVRKGGWMSAKKTFTIDSDVEVMQCMLSGQFTGSVQIGKIELTKLSID